MCISKLGPVLLDGTSFLLRIANSDCFWSAGLASTALVLSIAAPFGGSNWYYLTALSPLSGLYYWQRGTRKEEVQVSYSCLRTGTSLQVKAVMWAGSIP